MEQRLEFAPPQPPGFGRAATLALLAHLMLLAGLSMSVQWKRDTPLPAIEAELWSALPAQAAPKPVEPPPPPPAPEPPPGPAPKPVAAPPPPDPQVLKDAQIALERDKQKRLAEQKHQEQVQALAQQKLAQAKAEQAAKDRLAQDKREKAEQDKKLAEKKLAEERARRREAEERQDKAEKADKDKAKTAAAKAQAEADRKKQLDRVMGLAGATGEANATGTAQRSSGPSASYAGKVAARIKANIVFPDDIPGNPMAEVELRTAPDGSIVGTPRLVKSSGFKAWDDAVIKAILKTETLPRDIDGRVPSSFSIGLKPKE